RRSIIAEHIFAAPGRSKLRVSIRIGSDWKPNRATHELRRITLLGHRAPIAKRRSARAMFSRYLRRRRGFATAPMGIKRYASAPTARTPPPTTATFSIVDALDHHARIPVAGARVGRRVVVVVATAGCGRSIPGRISLAKR